MLKYSITQFERILKIMKRILVLHTGGTISMHADKAGRVVPDSDNPMNHASVKLDDIQINAIDFFNIPSPQITVEHMLLLTQKQRNSWLIRWRGYYTWNRHFRRDCLLPRHYDFATNSHCFDWSYAFFQ